MYTHRCPTLFFCIRFLAQLESHMYCQHFRLQRVYQIRERFSSTDCLDGERFFSFLHAGGTRGRQLVDVATNHTSWQSSILFTSLNPHCSVLHPSPSTFCFDKKIKKDHIHSVFYYKIIYRYVFKLFVNYCFVWIYACAPCVQLNTGFYCVYKLFIFISLMLREVMQLCDC